MYKICILLFIIFRITSIFAIEIDFSGIEKYKIIGFGEASHGDRTIYNVRARFIYDLKSKYNKINILVEMPQGPTYLLNDFFNYKIDTINFIKELKLFGLQTDSFLDFLSKFRNDQKISFYGIDIQHHLSSSKYLKENLIQWTNSDSLRINNLFKHINFKKELAESNNIDSLKLLIEKDLTEISKLIETNKYKLQKNLFFFRDIEYPLSILKQNYYYSVCEIENSRYSNTFRDSCMAVNTSLINDSDSLSLQIIFAANGHVTKRKGQMGGFLSEKYNDSYFSICTQYSLGTILMVDFDSNKWILKKKRYCALRNSLPSILKKEYSEVFITKNTIQTKKIKKALFKKQLILDIGAGINYKYKYSGFYYGIPFIEYDGIYFKREVEASCSLLNL